ncbi:multidrug transporter, partial [Adlercreutzia equolifaciens]|nr:multidrug transporter [Adlercreutzia equolifaciens]
DSLGWRMVYVIMMVLAALVAVIALASLRNYGKSEREPLDVPSVILSALGLVGVLYGISSMGDAGVTPFSIGLVVAGVVILALFVWRQTRLTERVLNMDVFRFRRFVIGLG